MVRKIETVQDVKEVANEILGKLVNGNFGYFNIAFFDGSGSSSCFFSPVTRSQTEKKKIVFVDDYEKLMIMLLSHEKVKELSYDSKGNMITAVFESPYKEVEEIDV